MHSQCTVLNLTRIKATFGYELAIDANLANVLYGLFKSPTFGQTKAGYVCTMIFIRSRSPHYLDLCQVASIFGLLNILTRPLGKRSTSLREHDISTAIFRWLFWGSGLQKIPCTGQEVSNFSLWVATRPSISRIGPLY